MSSDEDFSIVVNGDTETMERIQEQIVKLKEQHSLVLQEQKDLVTGLNAVKNLENEFKLRTNKIRQALEEDDASHAIKVENKTMMLASLRKEEVRLKDQIDAALEQGSQLEKDNYLLRQQTAVSTAVPEKKVVFTGVTGNDAKTQSFEMKPHVLYPMEEGTALITFEDEKVAQKILEMKEHKVELGECTITLEAKPVQMLVPSVVEMDTQICPHRVLVSSLPSKLSGEALMDKLELHFGKGKNGGAEVESTDLLQDSGNVVIKFVHGHVAKGLTDQQQHDVAFGKGKKHKVKVTPFLNGKITHFQTRVSECSHTVLLAGIPAIMEQENLQDLLEIHFQKSSNGGGEVEAFLYNPLGQHSLAFFQEECPIKD
ncbi:interferon-induced protein 35 [Osmerus mordax]|uniref:interferon-induced protein 35 n=1 Tax=Osmerus mordax TaxID=8014 RepID=UPI00350FD901